VRLLLIILSLVTISFSATLFQIDSVPDLQGNRELRTGNIQDAKHEISRHKATDPEYQLLKQAELAILKGDFSEAKRY